MFEYNNNEVKEYVIDDNGKLQEVLQDNETTLQNEENHLDNLYDVTSSNKLTEPVIKEKDMDLNSEFIKNPFLHNIHKNEVISIEDFYLKRKNKYYRFSSLIRSKTLGPIRTNVLIRKSFKEWKDEVDRKINSLNLVSDTRFSQSSELKKFKIGFLAKILCVLAIILGCIIINSKLWIFECPTGFFKNITYLSLILAIILLLFMSLFTKYIKTKNQYYENSKKEVKRQKSRFVNVFEVKYKDTYKYYARRINRHFKGKPLILSNTSVGDESLTNLENVINDSSRRIVFDSKREGKIKLLKVILKTLSFVPITYEIVLMIYQMIVYFIN